MLTMNALEPAQAPLFVGVPESDFSEIIAAAHSKEFTRREMLYFEGDETLRALVLTSGIVKITRFGARGTEVTLRVNGPGDVLGVADLLSTGRHSASAQAFRLSRTLIWDAPIFKSLVRRFPVLHQNMFSILGEELLELEERFREMAAEKAGPRVANQMLRLAKKIGRPMNGEIEIGLSREDLAHMTGTTLFTVSRLLSAWEARGTVRPQRGAVVICDVRSLGNIGRDSPLGNSESTD